MRVPAIALAIALAAAAPGCVRDAEEREMGERAEARLAEFATLLPEDAPASRFVEAVLGPLAEAARPLRDVSRLGGYRVRVLDTPVVNALALPGARLYVTTGLLSEARSCAELAGVLGHELAHAARRHGPVREAEGRFVHWLARVFLADTGSAMTADIATLLLQGTVYSREHEAEADEAGLRIAHAAGYDPEALVGFFERDATGGGAASPSFFRSHPTHAERVAALRAQIATEGLRGGTLACVGTPLTLADARATLRHLAPEP